MPDECISLTVTSPPYDSLRDYGGLPFDFKKIASELLRVTVPGGVIAWIVGEQIVNGGESGTSSEQRLHFRKIGLTLHHTLVFSPLGRRGSATNRHGGSLQYIMLLSKGRPRYVNLIRDIRNVSAGQVHGYWQRTIEGTLTKQRSVRTGTWRKRGPVWEYSVGRGLSTKDRCAFGHPAIMPEKLAEDLILCYSQPFDLVFDPMMGSATVCKMALLNDRHYLGMDCYAPYFEIAQERMALAHIEHVRRLNNYFDGYCPPTQADH